MKSWGLGHGRAYKGLRRVFLLALGMSLGAIGGLWGASWAYGQAPEGFRTDAVYLLDVTSSTVGMELGSRDILNELIDLLIADLDRFTGGRFVLITFANGPYDLDGAGPIRAIYRIEVDSEADKLYLKRFLRPQEYGPFPDDPDWPGVYEAVKRHRRGIFPTGVYGTILQALEILEEFQRTGGPDYARTHLQEIVVYTDGRNNAPFSPSFQEVLRKLQERDFAMLQRFRYKRYLFSPNPQDIQQAREECSIIEGAGLEESVRNVVAPDVRQLIILDFDRSILGFPNLWSPSGIEADSWTVTLKNIHVYYDPKHLEVLQGGRLGIRPVRAKDFGLPEDIAVRVSTTPDVLRFPLQSFDLSLTFEPFSRLEAYMREKGLEELKGVLHVVFEKEGFRSEGRGACSLSEEGEVLVDVRGAYWPVDVPFRRPRLTVETQKAGSDRIRLTLLPDEVYAGLPEEQRVVDVRLLPPDLLEEARDDVGQVLSLAQPVELPSGPRTLYLRVRASPETCEVPTPIEVHVSSPVPGVVLNGQIRSSVSFEYELGRPRLQPREWTGPNLWSAGRWQPGNRTSAELTLPLGVCAPFAGYLDLEIEPSSPSGSGLPASLRVTPSRLEVRGGRETLEVKLRIAPAQNQDWEVLGRLIREGAGGPHLRLKARYTVDSPGVLTLPPDPVGVRLVYEPRFLSLRVISLVKPDAEVSPGAEAFEWAVEGPSNTALIVQGLPIWKVEAIPSAEAEGGEGTPVPVISPREGEWRLPVPGRYRFRLAPDLPRSRQEGALEVQVEGGLPLRVLQEDREERRPEGSYRLAYRLQVVAPLVRIVCRTPSVEGERAKPERERRYRRGETVFVCEPGWQYLSEDQRRQVRLRATCPEGLILLKSAGEPIPCDPSKVQSLPPEPFQVQLGSKTPAGRLEPLLRSISIQAIYGEKTLETTLELEPIQGYLLPQAYDTFWQPLLFWAAVALTALPLVLTLGVFGYAIFYERENPLYILIDLADRWKGVLLGYAIALAGLWLIQGLVYGVLQWRYG